MYLLDDGHRDMKKVVTKGHQKWVGVWAVNWIELLSECKKGGDNYRCPHVHMITITNNNNPITSMMLMWLSMSMEAVIIGHQKK